MLQIFKRNPAVGIEIASGVLRTVLISGAGKQRRFFTAESELSPGVVTGSYSLPNIQAPDQLSAAFKHCLDQLPGRPCRAALTLPDGVFRIQTLEFDDLPGKIEERERLIRWRLEKTAAFDLADTNLRYQVLSNRDTRYTVLVCLAKRTVIEQYESLLLGWGLEPWTIGLTSFSTLNFYASYLAARSSVHALVHVTEEFMTTIVSEKSGIRFYRFKELKRSGIQEGRSRLLREIEDSLHFYTHRDRSQQSEVRHLYVSGQPDLAQALAADLSGESSLEVQVLSPGTVISLNGSAGSDIAAAAGAGMSL